MGLWHKKGLPNIGRKTIPYHHLHHVAPPVRISLTLSLTLLYCTLLPVDLQGYILYRHRTAECRFLLVILTLLHHVKGSTGICHLWVCLTFPAVSCMSGSSNLDSFHISIQLLLAKSFVSFYQSDLTSIWPIAYR